MPRSTPPGCACDKSGQECRLNPVLLTIRVKLRPVFVEVLRDRAGNGPGLEVEPGVTNGDFLSGLMLGTRQALYEMEALRESEAIYHSLMECTHFNLGLTPRDFCGRFAPGLGGAALATARLKVRPNLGYSPHEQD